MDFSKAAAFLGKEMGPIEHHDMGEVLDSLQDAVKFRANFQLGDQGFDLLMLLFDFVHVFFNLNAVFGGAEHRFLELAFNCADGMKNKALRTLIGWCHIASLWVV